MKLLKDKYELARMMLLAYILFASIDIAMFMTNGYALFSVPVIPQIVISYYAIDRINIILMILGVVSPFVIYAIAYIGSRKNRQMLLFALLSMIFDLAILIYVISLSQTINLSTILSLLISVLCISLVLRGYLSKKEVKTVSEKTETVSEKGMKTFRYDKEVAKENKCDKQIILYVIFVVYAFVLFFANRISLALAKENQTLYSVYFILLVGVGSAVFFYGYYKLVPFTMASSTAYLVKDNKVFVKGNGGIMELKDLKLLKENKDSYLCQYESDGKIKKLVIPYAYPGLEKYLKK